MKRLFLVLLLLLAAQTALAETYSWTDKQGTVHFTDSLGSVPAAYRKSAHPVGGDSSEPAGASQTAPTAKRKQPVAGDNGSVSSGVQSLKDQMMSDPGTMELIGAMKDDPELQAILSNPEIMKAVQSGDIGTLMNSPAFMKLLENPRVQEIQKRVQGGAK